MDGFAIAINIACRVIGSLIATIVVRFFDYVKKTAKKNNRKS